ncbi:Hypothetical protein FKW44_022284, partial [Caligus rogercresseyi]
MVAEKLSTAQPLDQSALRAILTSSSARYRLSPSGSRISQGRHGATLETLYASTQTAQ